MLYYLFEYLTGLGVPGSRLMSYITFRSGMALMLSLLIAIFIGKKIIAKLQSMQVGEIIRDLDLEGQMSKKGTPTMGGIIIIVSILIPCLLLGNLSSVYMVLMTWEMRTVIAGKTGIVICQVGADQLRMYALKVVIRFSIVRDSKIKITGAHAKW